MSLAPPRVQAVLNRLGKVRRSGKSWVACCPSHEDREPSLSVSEGRDGRVVLFCHAGCAPANIVGAIGLDMADLFPPKGEAVAAAVHPRAYQAGSVRSNGAAASPYLAEPTTAATEVQPEEKKRATIVAEYDYHDADGQLVFQVVRLEPKSFRQRRPDGKGGWIWSISDLPERPLYHLPAVREAASTGRPIFLVEGEKDADTLIEYGYVATTNAGGAMKWSERYAEALRGAHVIILPDNDDIGRTHAEQVAASLAAADCTVRVVELPGLGPKGDVTEWLQDGHDLDELDAIVGAAPRWSPPGVVKTRWRLDELWENDNIMRPPPPVVPRMAWAGRSTMLASAEKAGKSTLCGFMAAAVSLGGCFLGDPCEKGDVLLVGLEEFIGDAARRLKEFGADPKRVHLVDRLPADPRQRPQAVREHIEAVTPALVIVDTLMAYAQGIISDASASSQMQPIVQSLTDVAHDTGTALILVHHARKSDGRYRDSSAIGGAVDVIVEFFAPEEDADPTLRKVRARGRVPCRDFEFRFDGSSYHLAAGAGASLVDRIVDFVASHPNASHRAVRQFIGGKAETVDLAIAHLQQSGKLIDEGTDDRRSYRVPQFGSHRTPGAA